MSVKYRINLFAILLKVAIGKVNSIMISGSVNYYNIKKYVILKGNAIFFLSEINRFFFKLKLGTVVKFTLV